LTYNATLMKFRHEKQCSKLWIIKMIQVTVYSNTLMCFMQLFIVSNSNRTIYFANNKNQHFAFNADEQFLPIYELADENNKKINYLEEFADKFLKSVRLAK
jgi:type I restriction enzyme, R subunit